MSIQTFQAALLQRYPRLFVRDDLDFVRGDNELYIAAELQGDGSDIDANGRRLFDYYATEQDPGERFYVFGVNREIHDLATEHRVWIEWRDCASVGVYPL